MFRVLLFVLLFLPAAAQDLTQFVNPFIGTGAGASDFGMGNAAGNTPPGAAYPFGMVLWSPDTTHLAGGYRYGHDKNLGFSLTHISGRGIGCYQDFPVLPFAGAILQSPGDRWSDYGSTFRHENEAAAPGYYRVRLDNGVDVEITVTQPTGFARFTFPDAPLGTILINAGGSAQGNRDAGTQVRFEGRRVITGTAVSGDCGGWFQYRVFFAAAFDRLIRHPGTWDGSEIHSPDTFDPDGKSTRAWTSAQGAHSGAWAGFDTSENRRVQMKIGISYISAEKAYLNLQSENPGWDFEAVRDAARSAWNARLNTIRVAGGSSDQRTTFYTALYHAFIHPSTFSDADGEYLGFDNQVHNAGRRVQYHNFAGWDIYRSQIPLLALLARETSDMMQSLVNDAQQDPGGGLPRWQHANTNSGGMLGDSQDPVIASAYALGARDFDTQAAFAAMERGATVIGTTSGGSPVRAGIADYMALGYVSTAVPDSGSRTLEYATDDFAISQFARALGKLDRAAYYQRRAQNWRNLFHNGYLVPRNRDGSFPANYEPWSGLDYVEGSIAQYTWMVPFNMRGLFQMMGGNAAAAARLQAHLSVLNDGPWSEYAFMGNAPSLKTPWAFNFAGAPWRGQGTIRRILTALFTNSPGGLPGNDDLGTLSAWSVFASTGIYPHIPGVAGFVIGTPLFPGVSMHLADGRTIEINAPDAAPATPYVQSLRIDGAPYTRPWIALDTLAGARLDFGLAATPNPEWGSDPAAAPPSFDTPENATPTPNP